MNDGPAPTAQRLRIADEDLRRVAATGDPLAQMHRDIVSSAVRLHVPLRDVVTLRDQARIFRVLSSQLESLSHSKEEDWRVLFNAKGAILQANRLLAKLK